MHSQVPLYDIEHLTKFATDTLARITKLRYDTNKRYEEAAADYYANSRWYKIFKTKFCNTNAGDLSWDGNWYDIARWDSDIYAIECDINALAYHVKMGETKIPWVFSAYFKSPRAFYDWAAKHNIPF